MIYQIKLDNYQGETSFELYHHEANAYARMFELREENKNQDEFDSESLDEIEFFDPAYNEFSTYITLNVFNSVEDLFEDVP